MDVLSQEQMTALTESVGKQAAGVIAKEVEKFKSEAAKIAAEAAKNGGHITKESFDAFKQTSDDAFSEVKGIAEKQGSTINELLGKIEETKGSQKSIGQVFEDNQEELKKIFKQRSGTKDFMIQINSKGEFVMKPFDMEAKAAGPHATTANVGGAGNTSSIAQSIDAATLLRIGSDSPILSQYRNSPWILGLVNQINAGFEMPFAMWYEEQVKQGSSATVVEGGTKPLAQYAYQLKTNSYKKEAVLVGFTDEFALDFARLQSDILGKARVDLVNRINSQIVTNVVAAGTTYNTATQFKGGVVVPNVSDYDAVAALSAQVDNNTFGGNANTALISTFKKYRMGILKETTGGYLNAPGVLNPINFVGNPDLTADQLLVGDFKQYNVIMRGGLIVRVGYNGTDFAENRFSVVMEQFYFDYISALRTAAIVKGPDFATVKTAIST